MSTVCFLFWVSAGHLMISNHLLNYFPRLDIERRNCHGFTALMKAAMQGRAECVRALMMAGNDTPRPSLVMTGRINTKPSTSEPCTLHTS